MEDALHWPVYAMFCIPAIGLMAHPAQSVREYNTAYRNSGCMSDGWKSGSFAAGLLFVVTHIPLHMPVALLFDACDFGLALCYKVRIIGNTFGTCYCLC